MIAHFANNACIIALASTGKEEAEMGTRARLALIALGCAGLAAGGALLARAHRQNRSARGSGA
jgi:hypothetical protein